MHINLLISALSSVQTELQLLNNKNTQLRVELRVVRAHIPLSEHGAVT